MYRVFGPTLMNAPLNSDSQRFAASASGASTAPSAYAPSVPISVYRELATELKTTQSTLDALTQQNQQLLRQNKLLRNEIHRFVEAAEQLGHFAGVHGQELAATPDDMVAQARLYERPEYGDFLAEPADPPETPVTPPPAPTRTETPSQSAESHAERPHRPEASARRSQPPAPDAVMNSAIVPHPKAKKRDRPHPPRREPHKQRLFTEQPESMRPLTKVSSRSDFGNLWLATTILLVVVSAFGAGFLIMRPLLNR